MKHFSNLFRKHFLSFEDGDVVPQPVTSSTHPLFSLSHSLSLPQCLQEDITHTSWILCKGWMSTRMHNLFIYFLFCSEMLNVTKHQAGGLAVCWTEGADRAAEDVLAAGSSRDTAAERFWLQQGGGNDAAGDGVIREAIKAEIFLEGGRQENRGEGFPSTLPFTTTHSSTPVHSETQCELKYNHLIGLKWIHLPASLPLIWPVKTTESKFSLPTWNWAKSRVIMKR